MTNHLKIHPSAAELIAAELLDGESVDMGGWTATFADAITTKVERDDELADKLREFCAGLVSAADLRAYVEGVISDYAERNDTDWIAARDADRRDDSRRAYEEERLLRSAF